MVIYTWVYSKEVFGLVADVNRITKEDVMLLILEIVDIVMIANLVKMIITGSYNSFVDKSHSDDSEKYHLECLK